MSESGDLSVESLSEEENQKEDGNDEDAMKKEESEGGSKTFALSERKAKSGHLITDAWIYDDRQYYATSGYKISERVKRKQSFIFSFQDIFETLDSSTKGRQADIMAKGDTDWMCSDEESVQLARDCLRARDNINKNNNHSNEETTEPFKDHTSLSRNPYDRFLFNKTSSKRRLPSNSRKLSKPKSPSASETTSSDPMTSSADDRRQWIVVAEMAPQRASTDNVSAIGYKSATITMSEELATVSAAVASVLVFWSLLGAIVCLVLRFRRRKRRRRIKRHPVNNDDDVAHIDMLDEMIRTELARGRARMNNNASQCPAVTPSSPTYVNVPPPPQLHYGFRTTTTTAFDCVQVLNSYNAITHDRNGQNFYEYFVAGGGRQLVAARERVPPPPPPRSLYNSPNVERVTCVRLSNARSLEVLQRTVRPKKVNFHRSKSFTNKTPNAAATTTATTSNHHLQQDKGREQHVRQRVSSSAAPNINKRATTTEIGCTSTQQQQQQQHSRSNPYNHRPELSLVFSPMKTSFDKTRTPEHPTEATFLKCRGQFLPYHTPRSATSFSVPIGASGAHRCYDQGPPVPRHRWLDGCRESSHGNFRCYACPIQRADGNSRGGCGYYSSRPARFPKMGQSCLVGEFQRSGNNHASANRSRSSSSGRDKTELVEC